MDGFGRSFSQGTDENLKKGSYHVATAMQNIMKPVAGSRSVLTLRLFCFFETSNTFSYQYIAAHCPWQQNLIFRGL